MTSVAKAAYHAHVQMIALAKHLISATEQIHGHILLAPVSAPAHIVESSSALWNEVERVERQNNGQTARYFDVAIPVELNNDDKKKLLPNTVRRTLLIKE